MITARSLRPAFSLQGPQAYQPMVRVELPALLQQLAAQALSDVGIVAALPTPAEGSEAPLRSLQRDLREILQRHGLDRRQRDALWNGLLAALAERLLQLAHQQLDEEAWRLGRGEIFQALVGYLERAPAPGELELWQERLRVPAIALARSLRSLRRRYRSNLSAMLYQLAHTADGVRQLRRQLRRAAMESEQ